MAASRNSDLQLTPSALGTGSLRSTAENQSVFIEPWVRRCAAFAEKEGFRYFVFGLIVPRTEGRVVQFVLTNYPPNWLRLYDDQGYIRIDPVAARLLTGISPFAWDELHINGPKEGRFWKRAARFGLRYGYTVPVHGPRGQHAAIGLSGIEHPLPSDDKRSLFERSWSFAVQLLDDIFGTYLQDDGLSNAAPLNPKQRVALTMIAQGQSIREIGETLGLHSRTVEYHLGTAMRRLGAASREQAIVRALLSGDIEEFSYPGNLRDWCLRVGSD